MAYPNTQQNFYGYPNQVRFLNLPQTQEIWQNYGQPAIDWAKNQVAPKVGMIAAPIIAPGAIGYALNNPQGKFAAFAATNLGAPIVSKMKNLSGTPVIQSAEKNLNRVIDLFF